MLTSTARPQRLQCILRHDSKTLAIMQPGADKAIRSQVNCTAMPEAVQVLSLLDNIVVLSNFSGIGNLQFKVAESGVVKVIEVRDGA